MPTGDILSPAMTTSFRGWPEDFQRFFIGLELDNSKRYFEANRHAYEEKVKAPMVALLASLEEDFGPNKLFRPNRDIRFSKDKSPYKTNIGASFPWVQGRAGSNGSAEGPHGVGGYFHLQPGEIYVGGGMWHPEPARLAAWRTVVSADAERVHAALDDPAFTAEFGTVNGDRLKRVPPGFAPDHPEAELLKLKDVTFGRHLADSEALSPDLPGIIVEALAAATPVFRLLAGLAR